MSINKSRVVKISKGGKDTNTAVTNNWKTYIRDCAGNIKSLTTERQDTQNKIPEAIYNASSNFIRDSISPVNENAGYYSFLQKITGGTPISLDEVMEDLVVDDAVELVSKTNWILGNGITNEYENVIGGNSVVKNLLDNKVGDAVSGLITGAGLMAGASGGKESLYNYSAYAWWKGLEGWKSTNPVSITLNFDFALGQFGLWNSKKEVVIPMLNLIAMMSPMLITDSSMIGPTATPMGLLSSVIGDSFSWIYDTLSVDGIKNTVSNIAGSVKDSYSKGSTDSEGEVAAAGVISGVASAVGGITADIASTISELLLETIKKNSYCIQVGDFLSLTNCMCKNVNNIIFSNKVDKNGYPISGSLALTMVGMIPPTFSGTRQELVSLRFGV